MSKPAKLYVILVFVLALISPIGYLTATAQYNYAFALYGLMLILGAMAIVVYRRK